MKKKYRKTDDLGEKLDLVENFIYSSYICENSKCPIFNPIGDLNFDLDFLEHTSLKEAREAYGENTVDFKNFRHKYNNLILALNNIMKATYQLYVVRNTERHEKLLETENFKNILMFSKKSREEGNINISTVGPLENVIKNASERVFGKSVKRKDNERKSKAEEHDKYDLVGEFNEKRIEKELGKDLEKLRKNGEK